MKCLNCGSEMEEIGQCGLNRMFACRKCDPKLFKFFDKKRRNKK